MPDACASVPSFPVFGRRVMVNTMRVVTDVGGRERFPADQRSVDPTPFVVVSGLRPDQVRSALEGDVTK